MKARGKSHEGRKRLGLHPEIGGSRDKLIKGRCDVLCRADMLVDETSEGMRRRAEYQQEQGSEWTLALLKRKMETQRDAKRERIEVVDLENTKKKEERG